MSFWKEIGIILKKEQCIGFISLILSFLFWILKPDTKIDLWIFIIICIFSFYLCIIFLKASYSFYLKEKSILPKIISVRKLGDDYIFLIKPHEFFKLNNIVQFFYNSDDLEICIGCGVVNHIQKNKIIQIKIIRLKYDDQTVLDKIKNSDSTIINKIILSPYMNYNFF